MKGNELDGEEAELTMMKLLPLLWLDYKFGYD